MKDVTVKVVADRTGLALQTIRNYCDAGVIQARRDGRNYRIIQDADLAVKTVEKINRGELKLRDLKNE